MAAEDEPRPRACGITLWQVEPQAGRRPPRGPRRRRAWTGPRGGTRPAVPSRRRSPVTSTTRPVGQDLAPRARRAARGRGRASRSRDRGWPRSRAPRSGPGRRRRSSRSDQSGGLGRGGHVVVDDVVDQGPDTLERGRDVLEPVAGDGDDDGASRRRTPRPRPAAAARRCRPPTRARRRRRRARRGHAVRARICSSLTASNRPPDSSRAASASFQEAGLPIRIAVALVSGSGNGSPVDQRRRALGLEAVDLRQPGRQPEVGVLGVAEPVRGDVAGVADRQQVVVGGVAEEVDDLERRGLLALEPDRVDRVDQGDREVPGQLLGEAEAVVEVAARP